MLRPDIDVKEEGEITPSFFFRTLKDLWESCVMSILRFGPMPNHVAFIMDGNRRFAKKLNMKNGMGYNFGFGAFMSCLRSCYQLGVNYVTVYAFSIDNLRRDPTEVQHLMSLMKEKMTEVIKNRSVLGRLDCRVKFCGNLNLLNEPVRTEAVELMELTRHNTGPLLSVCIAYTSTDEIVHAVNLTCAREHGVEAHSITVCDIERNLYTAGCPEPDLIVRTSGETRLSNFLLWQSAFSQLQNPTPLWPEFSFWRLVWAITDYQRSHSYLEQRRKLLKKML